LNVTNPNPRQTSRAFEWQPWTWQYAGVTMCPKQQRMPVDEEKTHQNNCENGESDCFSTQGESLGIGAYPPKKLQNSPTSGSPTSFPSSAAPE